MAREPAKPLLVGLTAEEQREPATVATFEQVNLITAPGQTESGEPAISVCLRLADGTLLEGVTTWKLFRLAGRVLESRIWHLRAQGELPKVDPTATLDLRWDLGRGVCGAWDLDQLDKHALEALRDQVTRKIRGYAEGGPECRCLKLQDAVADDSLHFGDCPRFRMVFA